VSEVIEGFDYQLEVCQKAAQNLKVGEQRLDVVPTWRSSLPKL
jgi:hypothetical protein